MKEKEHNSYIGSLIHGITSLLTGMKTTMTVFWRKKTTEQYPENRKTLKLSERFRGTLTMPHNEKNEHHCVACGLCQTACPNDTIKVTSQTIETEDGKKKEDIGEVRIRSRFVHILPALRQCLPAQCHYVRPELRACRIRPQQTGTDAEPSGQSRRREEETRRSPA